MFRDECELYVRAGRGGDGAVSFRRERGAPFGGPDGGNGGDGGSVILTASDGVNSLMLIGRRPLYKARGGQPGGPRNRSGANGEDCLLEVPAGTQVYDAERGHLLRDLVGLSERCVIAAGGRGGRGNKSFASAVQQTPRRFEPGADGEERRIRLELKLIAEVGLVGLPNAGKSTLLSRVSQATPKVADYPFTTLVPHVGVAPVGDNDTLVLADLPGLIEGAAQGAGLGHRFLKHVERCRVLLHLVDVSSEGPPTPLEALRVVERELLEYSPTLAGRPRMIVATKCEDERGARAAEELAEATGRPVYPISAVIGTGLTALLARAQEQVRAESRS